jgi:hypothetical protein
MTSGGFSDTPSVVRRESSLVGYVPDQIIREPAALTSELSYGSPLVCGRGAVREYVQNGT